MGGWVVGSKALQGEDGAAFLCAPAGVNNLVKGCLGWLTVEGVWGCIVVLVGQWTDNCLVLQGPG